MPGDVPYAVTRRLFDLEHFVAFGASSPDARGALLPAAFQLLRTARGRGLPVLLSHTVDIQQELCTEKRRLYATCLRQWVVRVLKAA